MVIHLINLQPDVGRSSRLKTADSRQLIQEILPVYDLELAVSATDRVKSVIQQPDGKELQFKQNGGEVSIDIPRLDCHAMVVIEM